MNLKKFSALASFAVLTTGLLASVKPAQALVLETGSTVNIAGDITLVGIPGLEASNGEPLSTLDFLFFSDPQPAFPNGGPDGFGGEFVVIGGTGSFESIDPPPFVTGFVKDLPFELPINPTDPGSSFAPLEDFLLFPDVDGSEVTFDLAELADPVYTQSGNSTSVTIGATGNFDSDESTDVPGQFIFAAEFVDISADEVRDLLSSGGTLSNESNSGNGIVGVDVPEPSSIIGLVAFGLASAGFLGGTKKPKQLG